MRGTARMAQLRFTHLSVRSCHAPRPATQAVSLNCNANRSRFGKWGLVECSTVHGFGPPDLACLRPLWLSGAVASRMTDIVLSGSYAYDSSCVAELNRRAWVKSDLNRYTHWWGIEDKSRQMQLWRRGLR